MPPPRRNERLVKAFTLAEVLVTLGIIGVVSAMTLPTLVKNHQRQVYVTQLHKFYNDIANATEMYISDNNAVNLAETPLRNNSVKLKEFYSRYFKVVKDCEGSYIPCFAPEYKKLDGTTVSLAHSKCNVTLALASGAVLCSDSQAEDDTQGETEDDVIHNNYNANSGLVDIEFDINGTQGPNILGRDMFTFQINASGNIYDKAFEENGFNTSNMWGFVGKIIDDGWKMEY